MKLTRESMTYGADGLAHADNGKAVFVQGAVAGDTVEAEVVQDGKSFMRARTTEILEPSPDRIQPPCPFVGICGGCSWGNLSRTAQLAAKEQNLRSCLLYTSLYGLWSGRRHRRGEPAGPYRDSRLDEQIGRAHV